MKKHLTETRVFRIEIPKEELVQILIDAGYNIPNDAKVRAYDDYGTLAYVSATWERKVTCPSIGILGEAIEEAIGEEA